MTGEKRVEGVLAKGIICMGACALLLAGCAPKEGDREGWRSHQELGYECIAGLDWGMSPAQAAKALGFEEKDLAEAEPEPVDAFLDEQNQRLGRVEYTLPAPVDWEGIPVELRLIFFEGTGEWYGGLVVVKASCGEGQTFEDVTARLEYYDGSKPKAREIAFPSGEVWNVEGFSYYAGEVAEAETAESLTQAMYKLSSQENPPNGMRLGEGPLSNVSVSSQNGEPPIITIDGLTAAVLNNLGSFQTDAKK